MLVRRLMANDASIRFLGVDDAMIALFETGDARSLFILGEPDDRMLTYVPQLLTVGHTRVDVIVGSHRWLTSAGVRSATELHTAAVLSLQTDASLSPISGDVTVVTNRETIRQGNDCEINISVAAGSDGDDPDILIEIGCKGATIVLVNRASAMDVAASRPTLLAAPGEVDTDLIVQLKPGLFLGTALHTDADFSELQMFFNDPVGFAIRDGGVAVRENQLSS